MDKSELTQLILYFSLAALSAVVATLFIQINEVKGHIQSSNKSVTTLTRISNVFLLIRELFVNGLLGGLSGIVANHDVKIAILVGFFSQFIALTLIKWVRTRNFSVAITEIAGAFLKSKGISNKENYDDKNKKQTT